MGKRTETCHWKTLLRQRWAVKNVEEVAPLYTPSIWSKYGPILTRDRPAPCGSHCIGVTSHATLTGSIGTWHHY
ncbi:hypothetical protein GOBAR_AA34227 [Gossypium barbadense]|uniref:Uncharacterized protein n=1 Tax=Gossypium barbadense TaxID=3634 RepID=A0A2P5W5T5_GOSBA|nr:hypothetical protein GOBAR_AA34227 [Gossypium barbadense]